MGARALAFAVLVAGAAGASCGDDGGNDGGIDADPNLINGCPSLTTPQASPGDPIDGDTFATFAGPTFQQFCTRCHSTATTGAARNGAPIGYNWDDEASVRMHLPEIRNAIGVLNFMPPNEPRPPCADRQRMVRWIDAAAP